MIKIIHKSFNRLEKKIRFGIPLFNRAVDREKVKNILEILDGVESCAIIGKGGSIFYSNPASLIASCDLKILLNRVDVENLEKYIGKVFDVQITQPDISEFATFPKHVFSKYGIKYVVSNRRIDEKEFNRFYANYCKHNITISCIPDDNKLKYSFSKSSYSHRTQCGSILKVLYNVDTLREIVFAGVDFYEFPYQLKKQQITDQKERSGKPLLKFIFDTIPMRHKIFSLRAYFPKILKEKINFPDNDCFRFYE